jgi:integrase
MSYEQQLHGRTIPRIRSNIKSKKHIGNVSTGLKRFTEWYRKTANEILEERVNDWTSGDLFKKKRFAREIEKFHAYLIKEQGYKPNSATYYYQGIRSLFSFYEMPVKLNSEIDRRRTTTRDYVPRIDQYAEMFKVADNLRDKLIVSMGLTLAWRISDFSQIKKSDLPNLEQETPIPFEKLTQKEQVIAKSFLSDESVELLKDYLPTLGENPHLFPSNGKGHLDHTTFNRIVKALILWKIQ